MNDFSLFSMIKNKRRGERFSWHEIIELFHISYTFEWKKCLLFTETFPASHLQDDIGVLNYLLWAMYILCRIFADPILSLKFYRNQ